MENDKLMEELSGITLHLMYTIVYKKIDYQYQKYVNVGNFNSLLPFHQHKILMMLGNII